MKSTMHPLLLGLDRQVLSTEEILLIEDFEKDQDCQKFLPVSDLLASYGYEYQSLELLIQGVERHPQITTARVHLMQKLFLKGLFRHSWQVSEQSPYSLDQNPTAFLLKWKLAVLLQYEKLAIDLSYEARKREISLKIHSEDYDLIISGFLSQVQYRLRKELQSHNIPLEDLDKPTQEVRSSIRTKNFSRFERCHLTQVLQKDSIFLADEPGLEEELGRSLLSDICASEKALKNDSSMKKAALLQGLLRNLQNG